MADINATLIAQILNFLVLLAILAKFAYKPLLNVMEERRNRIANDLDSAEQTRLQAEQLKAEYEKMIADARSEATAIVERATKVAQNLHDDLVEQARVEKEEMIASAKEQIEAEKKQAMLDIRSEVIALSTVIAGKIIDAKLDSAKDQELAVSVTDEVLKERN